MTIDELLDQFYTVIQLGVEIGESVEDIKTAARIIIEARLEFSERAEPSDDDGEVAFMALCFMPIPGGPPKTPDYKKKIRKYRRDMVRGSRNNEERRWQIRSSIRATLKHVSPDEFSEFDFDDFFAQSRPQSQSQPPPVSGY